MANEGFVAGFVGAIDRRVEWIQEKVVIPEILSRGTSPGGRTTCSYRSVVVRLVRIAAYPKLLK